MHFKAIIFDLDGTLLDSLADIADATEKILQRYGLPSHPYPLYHKFIGNGLAKLLERAAPTVKPSEEQFARMLSQLRDVYAQNWAVRTKPYPDITRTLEQLKQRGCKLAVLSNKDHAFTVDMVEHFFGKNLFDAVQGLEAQKPAKPDPATTFALCKRFCLKPSEVLFVGDMSVDMLTARNAAMPFTGVTWGFRPEEVRDADYCIDSPVSLLKLLDKGEEDTKHPKA